MEREEIWRWCRRHSLLNGGDDCVTVTIQYGDNGPEIEFNCFLCVSLQMPFQWPPSRSRSSPKSLRISQYLPEGI